MLPLVGLVLATEQNLSFSSEGVLRRSGSLLVVDRNHTGVSESELDLLEAG